MKYRRSERITAQGVYLVSLGCPKNLVDSEVIAGLLVTNGIPLNFDKKSAAYYLINTCAFLPGARQECCHAIEEGIRWKNKAPEVRKLIVAGCLIQQDKERKIIRNYPEVDAWSGVDGVGDIINTFENAANGYITGNAELPCYLYDEKTPRLQLTLPHTAYLKIADGCNNCCSYCSIPLIRGRLRSRSIESVLQEARNLIAAGVKELILIAQDVTAYGADRSDGATLAGLLHELDKLEGEFFLRLLYTHPAHYTEEFFAEYKVNKHLLPYLDIPLQHINDRILSKMGRKVNRARIEEVLHNIRTARPESIIRTTFITGLPGEGDAEFAELEEFIQAQKFSRLGVFSYSPEPGTPAAGFPDRPDLATAEARAEKLMQIQQTISLELNQQLLGKTVTVICDQADGRNGIGRTLGDAPEIDNTVYFTGNRRLQPGEICQVCITEVKTFDLYGKVC
ncbi:MAG: 30S ribosomal protein S12 methylthiotransferase RimO [Lentisphaerae bacterium]|nr:30S ribosomal protein S12 methylthiotransferase RimO [Lentisphaerota bacterium]